MKLFNVSFLRAALQQFFTVRREFHVSLNFVALTPVTERSEYGKQRLSSNLRLSIRITIKCNPDFNKPRSNENTRKANQEILNARERPFATPED